MKAACHKLLRSTGGKLFFAEVGIEPSSAPSGQEISISATAFEPQEDIKYYPEWVAAAKRGVRYALTHAVPMPTSGISLRVTKILGTLVDTSEDAVAAAACLATWDALEVSGSHPPRFEAGKIVFET